MEALAGLSRLPVALPDSSCPSSALHRAEDEVTAQSRMRTFHLLYGYFVLLDFGKGGKEKAVWFRSDFGAFC